MTEQMKWPKPKPKITEQQDDGTTVHRMDLTPHPSFITIQMEAKASDYVPEFVDKAVRFYLLMTTGITKKMARQLANTKHYSLHIEEQDDHYLLTVVSNMEEE